MSRTIKSVKRPDEHVFIDLADEPTEFDGSKRCGLPSCGLPRSNSVHITGEELAESLPARPEADRSDEIVGSE